MKRDAAPKPGRPRGFDRDAALEKAMHLFWRQGYEGTSLEHLTSAMGITPPSLYSAFENKATLYREALGRFVSSQRSFDVDALRNASELSAGVHALLAGAVADVTRAGGERGCMVSIGMLACHPDNRALASHVARMRRDMRENLADALEPHVGAKRAGPLSRHLLAMLQGIAVQAHDGTSRAELMAVVDEVAQGVSR